MDYARKIGKQDEQSIIENIIHKNYKEYRVLTKKPSVEIYKEDNRLANWKKWLKIRQRQHRFLSRATNRLPEELVLNSSERHHGLAEMRNKMYVVASTIDANPVKLRSLEPGFWRTFEFLSEKLQTDDACHLSDVVETAPVSVPISENERKPKFEVTRNVIPDLILKEKNLEGIDEVKSLWKKSKYLRKQIKKSSPIIISSVFAKSKSDVNAIDLIEDKEPKSLVVKGEKLNIQEYKTKIEKPLRTFDTSKLEELEEPLFELSPNFETNSINESSRKVSLKVEISSDKNEKEASNDMLRNVIFTDDTSENKHIITLENTGNIVIFYQWRKLTSLEPRETIFSNPFVFNKNAGKIIPDDKISISVWFIDNNVSQFPRISLEFWSLEIKPATSMIYTFRMWGMSRNLNLETCSDSFSVSRRLDNHIRNRIIQEIIEDMLLNAYDIYENNIPPEPSYETFFVERDLFEAFNKGYHYHRDKMSELRKIHLEVDNSLCWDLSLKNLRLKIITTIKDPETRHDLLSRFYEICKNLFKPPTVVIPWHPICFKSIITSFVNCFEKEHEYVVENCFVGTNENLYTTEFEDYFESFETTNKDNDDRCASLRKEIFYLRILSKLIEMVNKLCAAVDSEKNLRKSTCSYLDKSLIFEKKEQCNFPEVKMRKSRLF